jgi:hypothetical protein
MWLPMSGQNPVGNKSPDICVGKRGVTGSYGPSELACPNASSIAVRPCWLSCCWIWARAQIIGSFVVTQFWSCVNDGWRRKYCVLNLNLRY